ncbi:MAG: AmmeMemoRadiSam system protein B [Patescibacteria group bacterium]|jgi:AmmeMemoRadiSam system protein B
MKSISKFLIFSIAIILVIIGFLFGIYLAQINSKKEVKLNNNFHYSEINQKDFYDNYFAQAGDCQDNYNENIKGVVVNHHLLAGKFMARAFCAVATDKAMTVVIISPNHFMIGRGQATLSAYDFKTPYGILEPDKKLIQKMSDMGIANIDERPFEREHGIYNLMPFIKKAMPNARIVPIIIKDNISEENKNKLVQFLSEGLPKNSLIVASLDFSHYLTSDSADVNDVKTLEVIKNLDYNGVSNLNKNNQPDNVDSKPTLEMFLRLMTLARADNFTLLDNSNSAKLIGDLNIRETTSYIVGYFFR